MGNQTRYSFSLRLPQVPLADDSYLYKNLLPIHTTIHQLAQQLDQYTGRYFEYPENFHELGTNNINSVGLNRFYAVADTNIPAGSLIYFIPAGATVKAALASASAVSTFAQGISLEAVASGAWGEFILSDTLLETTGLTVGSIYYLSNTPGAYTTTAPTNQQIVGVALSATKLFVHLVGGGGGGGGGGTIFPVGHILLQTTNTNPATYLGYGTWSAIGAGKVLVGYAAGDPDFGTAGASVGSKTSTPDAHSGTAVAAHTVTNPTIAWPAGVPTASGAAVADHASHTHTYTQVPNHTHPFNVQGGTTASTTGTNVMTSTATGGSSRTAAIATSNPSGGVATGTTNGPSATLTHTVTQPTIAWPAGVPTASGTAVSAHSVTQPNNHAAMSVIQPSLVVYMFERTA